MRSLINRDFTNIQNLHPAWTLVRQTEGKDQSKGPTKPITSPAIISRIRHPSQLMLSPCLFVQICCTSQLSTWVQKKKCQPANSRYMCCPKHVCSGWLFGACSVRIKEFVRSHCKDYSVDVAGRWIVIVRNDAIQKSHLEQKSKYCGVVIS